jgi:hypothetical protein
VEGGVLIVLMMLGRGERGEEASRLGEGMGNKQAKARKDCQGLWDEKESEGERA